MTPSGRSLFHFAGLETSATAVCVRTRAGVHGADARVRCTGNVRNEVLISHTLAHTTSHTPTILSTDAQAKERGTPPSLARQACVQFAICNLQFSICNPVPHACCHNRAPSNTASASIIDSA